MPKTKKDLIKRQFAYAMRNLMLAMNHLANLEALFETQHEDLSDILKVSIVGINEVKVLLDHFAYKVWGWENKDYFATANLPKPTEEIAKRHLTIDHDETSDS